MNIKNKPIYIPNKILLGLQEGKCNLQCPKCFTHGSNRPSNNKRFTGVMPFPQFKLMIEEIAPYLPQVTPQTWDEPLLTPNLVKYLTTLKEYALPITMDTNGILLNKQIRRQLLDLEVDSIFISLDAFNEQTYQKVRGQNMLPVITKNVLNFLEERKKSKPRIGVSFVKEPDNIDELDKFINFWQTKVDVIRVVNMFQYNRTTINPPTKQRTPCWSLYDSIMVHPNGDAGLCCVDTHHEVKLGNVFSDGLIATFNNENFNHIRKLHQSKQFNKISICHQCQLWSYEEPTEKKINNILIKQTPTHTYYNRIDKLNNIITNNRFIKC